jgi:hypothetical protein
VNKTIYIRDEDVPVWERAKGLAGDKLAPVVVDGLRKYVAQKESEDAESRGFERIVLSFQDADDYMVPKKKAFMGKWLIPADAPFRVFDDDGREFEEYAVAVTPRNAAVFYYWTEEGQYFHGRHFKVFPSLKDAAADQRLRWAAIKAIETVGVPVEELDI